MSKLVDSVRSAQSSVSSAFDQLVSDIEADEAADTITTGDGTGTGSALVKVVAYYEDGSTVELAPPTDDDTVTGDAEVKDLTEEAPANGEEKSGETQTPPQAPTGDSQVPGNAEQV